MNSKFFHSRLRWRRLNNGIKGTFINEEWCKDPDQVKIEVRKHFENRFQAQTKLRVNLDGVSFSRIDNVDNEVLCNMFSESKILAAVGQCGSSKSPGPDGYNFHVLKYNWDIIGDKMINVIQCFYETGYILRGCNASFISFFLRKLTLLF